MKFKSAILTFLALFLAASVRAETVTAAGDPWPPFIDPNDPDGGVAVSLAREAFSRSGFTLEMNIMPWARAIDGVKNAKYDVLIGTWWTKERTEFLDYSEPYLTNEIKFIKRKGDPFEYNGMDSLTGKSVGIVRGYGYGDEFLNATNFKRPETADFLPNVKKVVSGRVDLTLEDELVARSQIAKEEPGLIDQIEFTQNALNANTLHVTCGLANAKHEEIINALNKGMAAMKADGTFDQILKKYGMK
ncbi:transporter substrate-binding domain-containing protein [Hahella sp. KA22]|uniref:transporter substrate-binding domain-containing protein n=1 Tax=Hahella sp. KA22 TaxID=1628392 RepID=UPI000FDD9D4A|nr:transporter substrate-binding domain-containing protein [Hahella sp. KA22]AZZ91948.1 transporter substrate-binding domain-containing protein [Hahella sp. KA22]QAY55319.1 transporter substrate-binding domain-containing protein [Hahella sp. KA22]